MGKRRNRCFTGFLGLGPSPRREWSIEFARVPASFLSEYAACKSEPQRSLEYTHMTELYYAARWLDQYTMLGRGPDMAKRVICERQLDFQNTDLTYSSSMSPIRLQTRQLAKQ